MTIITLTSYDYSLLFILFFLLYYYTSLSNLYNITKVINKSRKLSCRPEIYKNLYIHNAFCSS